MSLPGRRHRRSHGDDPRTVAFAILTVSDTRTEADDASGRVLRERVEAAGHRVHDAAIVPDDVDAVRERIAGWASEAGCEAIVTTGGTGVAARDRTVEAAESLFDRPLAGFGELFRRLSYDAIGPSSILSRATAGIVRATPVFVLPGSPAAVALALEKIILPVVGHLVGELARQRPDRGQF